MSFDHKITRTWRRGAPDFWDSVRHEVTHYRAEHDLSDWAQRWLLRLASPRRVRIYMEKPAAAVILRWLGNAWWAFCGGKTRKPPWSVTFKVGGW